jgi:alkylation response protein AidB-like acyl-CoA dehydrogenase
MDFSLTEERQMLADTLNRWVMNDYPLAGRLAAAGGEDGFDRAKYAALADLGVLGALVPESAGGFGGAGFDISVVFEALGRGLVVEPVLQSAVLAGGVLVETGADADLLEAIIGGGRVASLAWDEAGTGGDPALIEAVATQADGGWTVTGAKCVVRNAGQADVLIVAARTGAGIGLFKVAPDARGLALQDYPTIDGGRAAEVVLDGVAADCLAEDGAGVLERVLGRGVLALCAEAVGIMDVIKDMTVEYTRTRKQFGVPIGKFQALQHRMAEMLLEVEQARSAVIKAAFHEADTGEARERAISAAKVTIGRVGTLVTEESIQIHGGMGMTWEYPLGHFAKRLTMIGTELGDEEYHLRRYIALGRAA